MDVEAPQALLRQFEQVEAPRVERSTLHLLTDMLVITLCAVLCGADTCPVVALYGRAKRSRPGTLSDSPRRTRQPPPSGPCSPAHTPTESVHPCLLLVWQNASCCRPP